MKTWFVRKVTALFEISGRRIPGWIRGLVSKEEFERIRNEEAELTACLRQEDRSAPSMPERLKGRIDAAVAREEPENSHGESSRQVLFPLWAMAAAAVFLVGLSLYLVAPGGGVLVERDSKPVALVQEDPESVDPVEMEPPVAVAGRATFSQDVLLQPLAEEQARLASDMTNAIQFVASSLLPEEYAKRVESNLDSLEKEFRDSL